MKLIVIPLLGGAIIFWVLHLNMVDMRSQNHQPFDFDVQYSEELRTSHLSGENLIPFQ